MTRQEIYESGKTWKYPATVITTINKEIKTFYDRYNKGKAARDKIKRFNNERTFFILFSHIQNSTALDFPEMPKASWLQDLYNGLKNNSALNRRYIEALLATFGFVYDPITDKLNKKEIPPSVVNPEMVERANIIKFMSGKSRKTAELYHFIGKYKYFAGARRENTIYDPIYEHDLEIFETGKVEIHNPFNHHTYLGFAVITTNGNLQIVSYSFDGALIDGIGKLLSFRINKYGRLTLLIPGMEATFHSDDHPIAAENLLCTNLSYNKHTPIIREYFDSVVSQLRMYVPELTAVEKLVVKHHKLDNI
jgi:hypothetical protein